MKFVTIVSTAVISTIAIMAFITLAFSAQGNKAIIEPATITPLPIIVSMSTPTPTAVPDNGIEQTQYGYVITYPAPITSYEINPNPDYMTGQSSATTPTVQPRVTPTPTPKPSPTHRPIPTIMPRITPTPVP